MKVSEQWLREWVQPAASALQLGERLTMAGLELDGLQPVAPDLTGVVVARIESTAPHPDADKLQICQVRVGSDELRQIVCGAKNARAGLTVALATEGTVLPGGMTIKAAQLRGVDSFGMLCGASELGMQDEIDGLWELDDSLPLGQPITQALHLDDVVLDIDLTPNRSDCLSVAGIAREVSALYDIAVTAPEISELAPVHAEVFPVNVSVPQHCPRYCGRVINNVNAQAKTPVWMQEALRRSGINCISILVDICNFVMLELGQPMHAFDLDQLNSQINVRMAHQGERCVLLDGKEITLSDEHLVIADDAQILALAGIMGGQSSAVTTTTQNIFLESAYFDLLAIAGKARQFGLHTESSHRFERGVDPQLPLHAMHRASALLVKYAQGAVGPVIEQLSTAHMPVMPSIDLAFSSVQRVLGIELAPDDIATMFENLGCAVVTTAAGLQVSPPSYRFDLAIEEDLIEEIARLSGYDQFPTQPLAAHNVLAPQASQSDALYDLHQNLVSMGYTEAVTFSFMPQEWCQLFAEEPAKALANPISSELSHMRTSLWPGLCSAAGYNLKRQQTAVRLYEIGRKYRDRERLEQTQVLAGVVVGDNQPRQWGVPTQQSDFYDVKGHLQQLFQSLGSAPELVFKAAQIMGLHPGKSANICYRDQVIGCLGVLHPHTAKALDMAEREVIVFELAITSDWLQKTHQQFQLWSKFPQVRRDITVLVSQEVEVQALIDCIQMLAIDALQDIVIFSVYQGEGVSEGLKSVSLGLILQDISSTLKDQQVDTITSNIITQLSQTYNAELRSS